MSKTLLRLTLFIFAIIFTATTSGVFATWYFAENPVTSASDSVGANIVEFVWKPEEILPSETPGQNYIDLFESILNNDKAGLNSNKGVLEDAVINDSDGIVHSEQNVQGGNLKHLFITNESRDLDFIMEYISDTEFHAYMYKSSDVTGGAAGVTRVKVYMTIYVKQNGTWIGQETQFGYATVQFFPGSSRLSIDPDTWSRTQ